VQCENARERLSIASERASPGPELLAHLSSCEACQKLRATEDALDRVLALDTVQEPGPGFDTRFFARLEAERSQSRRKRSRFFAMALLPAAAALAAGVLWLRPGSPTGLAPAKLPTEALANVPEAFADEDELGLLRDLELIEELEIVARLDDLEAFELLEQLEPEQLEQIASENP
jgi:hypothetical protein